MSSLRPNGQLRVSLLHGDPLNRAKNGVHLIGVHHRPKRWGQEGVLAGRLPISACHDRPFSARSSHLISD